MTTFHRGDRVVLRNAKCAVFDNKPGTVEGYDHLVQPAPVLVRFDHWSLGLCHCKEADLVRLETAACRTCAQRGHMGCDPTCEHWLHDLRQE